MIRISTFHKNGFYMSILKINQTFYHRKHYYITVITSITIFCNKTFVNTCFCKINKHHSGLVKNYKIYFEHLFRIYMTVILCIHDSFDIQSLNMFNRTLKIFSTLLSTLLIYFYKKTFIKKYFNKNF